MIPLAKFPVRPMGRARGANAAGRHLYVRAGRGCEWVGTACCRFPPFHTSWHPRPPCVCLFVCFCAVCALHGVSPRDRWLCVLPGWQMNVNVKVTGLHTPRNAKHQGRGGPAAVHAAQGACARAWSAESERERTRSACRMEEAPRTLCIAPQWRGDQQRFTAAAATSGLCAEAWHLPLTRSVGMLCAARYIARAGR